MIHEMHSQFKQTTMTRRLASCFSNSERSLEFTATVDDVEDVDVEDPELFL
jgi:hypothetical protein